MSTDITDKSPAEVAKDAGNVLFKEGHYAQAIVKYNEAIDLDPEVPAFYTNRAFCHLKMENHGLVIADATVAIELDKTFVKAYHRRGSAYMALAQFKNALKDFKAAKQLKPNDRDVLEKYKAAEKEVPFATLAACRRPLAKPAAPAPAHARTRARARARPSG